MHLIGNKNSKYQITQNVIMRGRTTYNADKEKQILKDTVTSTGPDGVTPSLWFKGNLGQKEVSNKIEECLFSGVEMA